MDLIAKSLMGSYAKGPIDPYFEYTTLLLSGNGLNGAQNGRSGPAAAYRDGTFLDSSTNNFTITRNPATGPNAPTQGTFSPFSQTGWGNYFNGSSSLTPSSGSFLAVGTNNYTIEFWVYLTANAAANHAIAINATNGLVIVLGPTKTSLNQFSVGDIVATGSGLSINTWHHVAIVRSGTGSNQTAIYIDGVRDTVGTDATNWTATGNPRIGGNTASQYITGYLSNIRVVNSAIYSGTNITVPISPLSPSQYAGTTFLTCQNNRFLDNGSTQATFTANGSPTVVAFSPFNPSASWSAATYGGSGYFDGSGDYLEAGTASNWTFLSNTTALFSIEAWVYLSSAPATLHPICFTNAASSGNIGFGFWVNSSRRVGAEITIGSAGTRVLDATTTGTIQLGAWNYVAITYDQSLASGNCKIYINDAAAETFNKTGTTPSSSNPATALLIGRSNSSTHAIGYYGSLRISNVIRTITVPTAPYTSDANTSLLLNFTNAGIYDATSKNDLETVGNAQISNAVTPKWGSTSIKFDGTGDSLITSPSIVNSIGTGDFTIEFWCYPSNTTAAYRAIVASENYASVAGGWTIYQNGTGIEIYLTSGTVVTAASQLVASTWQHIALVRSGSATNNCKLYVNGTNVASATNTADWTGQRIFIGDNNYTGTDYFFNGYIQDLRITKGYARYTANFTPPTAAFPTL